MYETRGLKDLNLREKAIGFCNAAKEIYQDALETIKDSYNFREEPSRAVKNTLFTGIVLYALISSSGCSQSTEQVSKAHVSPIEKTLEEQLTSPTITQRNSQTIFNRC